MEIVYSARIGYEYGRRDRGKHLQQQRDWQRWLYHSRRRRGLCVKCGAPAAGKVRCPRCALRHLEAKRFTRRDVKNHGSRKNPRG